MRFQSKRTNPVNPGNRKRLMVWSRPDGVNTRTGFAFEGGAAIAEAVCEQLAESERHIVRCVLYVRDIADNADQLAHHLARGERKEAVRIMHTLKGLSRTIGAHQLADFAARHEKELKHGALDPQKIDALVQQTLDGIHAVSAEVRAIVDVINAHLAPKV